MYIIGVVILIINYVEKLNIILLNKFKKLKVYLEIKVNVLQFLVNHQKCYVKMVCYLCGETVPLMK